MTNNQVQQVNPWGFQALTDRLYAFVDSLNSSKRKTYGFTWLAIAIVLAVVASLPLPGSLRWVSAIVGWPSGVILFALTLAVIHGTSLKDTSLFHYKDRVPPRRRVPVVIIGLILVAVLLIATSSFIPTGVGGTIIIYAALSAYNIIRRTREELALAAQGLPDPREIPEDDEEEEREE